MMVELQVKITLEIEGEEKVATLDRADAERLLGELQQALGKPQTVNSPAPLSVPFGSGSISTPMKDMTITAWQAGDPWVATATSGGSARGG
jgi:hypothetical protein